MSILRKSWQTNGHPIKESQRQFCIATFAAIQHRIWKKPKTYSHPKADVHNIFKTNTWSRRLVLKFNRSTFVIDCTRTNYRFSRYLQLIYKQLLLKNVRIVDILKHQSAVNHFICFTTFYGGSVPADKFDFKPCLGNINRNIYVVNSSTILGSQSNLSALGLGQTYQYASAPHPY